MFSLGPVRKALVCGVQGSSILLLVRISLKDVQLLLPVSGFVCYISILVGRIVSSSLGFCLVG